MKTTTKRKTMKAIPTYERHPLSAEYDPIEGPDWDRMVAGVKKHGIVADRKITLYEGQVLDGWHLYQACKEAGVTPKFSQLPKKMDPEEFVEIVNDNRRHEGMEQKAARRARRIERVEAARKEGKSTRQIAVDEGVSQRQVMRDLQTSGESYDSPGPKNGTVTGSDGKNYKASAPAPEPKVLCKRCQRVGACRGCTNCKMAREAAKNGDGKGDAYEGKEKEPKVALMDQVGNPVPKMLRDTFVGCRDSLESGVKLLQEVARTVKGLTKWNAWMRPADMEKALGNLIEDMKSGLPHSVCQDCEGKGCKKCRQEGWLTRWRHAELAAK